MAFCKIACNRCLFRIFGSNAVLLASFCHSIVHLLILCQSYTNLMAFGGSDPALLLQFTPRDIVLFWADQTEDVCFSAIFTYQGCSEAKSSFGLNFCRHAEDGSGE